jgi:hypothetical protein
MAIIHYRCIRSGDSRAFGRPIWVFNLHSQDKAIHSRNNLTSKEMFNCAVNKQVHTYNIRNNYDYIHNLELYNSKPSAAGCYLL